VRNESLGFGKANVFVPEPDLALEIPGIDRVVIHDVEAASHGEIPERPQKAVSDRAGASQVSAADVDHS